MTTCKLLFKRGTVRDGVKRRNNPTLAHRSGREERKTRGHQDEKRREGFCYLGCFPGRAFRGGAGSYAAKNGWVKDENGVWVKPPKEWVVAREVHQELVEQELEGMPWEEAT